MLKITTERAYIGMHPTYRATLITPHMRVIETHADRTQAMINAMRYIGVPLHSN